jgi:hypothetical protein
MDRDEFHGLPEVKQAPAIGYSIVSNMGGDRQMTVQCFVAEDEDLAVINSKIDRIFSVLDRKKAHYDLTKLEKEIEEVGRHLRNFLNAIPMAEKTAEHQIAVLKVKLAEQEKYRDELEKDGYNEHIKSGRKGNYVPKGHALSKINAVNAEIEKTREAIAAVPKDTEQHRETTRVNVQRYKDDLKKRRAEINDLRMIAGLPPYMEFLVEETAEV